MNCFNHPELVSVAVCQDCKKGLCHQCASKYNIPICSQCVANRNRTEKSIIYREFLWYLGVGFILVFILAYLPSQSIDLFENNIDGIKHYLLLMFLGASIVAGWKTLDKLTSNYFLFLPIFGWVLYFFVKFAISAMIGYVMLPIRTYKNIQRLIQLKKIPV